MAESFRKVFDDIRNGGFAKRFQEEARNGYPMLEFARAMIHGGSPITEAEDRIRLLHGRPTGSPCGMGQIDTARSRLAGQRKGINPP